MSNIRRGRGKAPRRPAAEVPTGLLDAYTESVTTNTMSDSDKFREGYVNKKDKVRLLKSQVKHYFHAKTV